MSIEVPPVVPVKVVQFQRPPSFCNQWQADEGIPIYKVFHIERLSDVALGTGSASAAGGHS